HNVKATFFMLGKSINRFPEVAKQVADEGHEIANHSITHANLNKAKKSEIQKEVIDSKKIIQEVTGIEPKLFRPPYGEYNDAVIKAANASDQTIVMWSVDTLDWKHKDKNKVINLTMTKSTAKSIVLLHDIHESTADALPGIIEKMQKEGFEFVTTSELIKHLEAQANGVYYGK
ncbi:MAG TPA: polysaccharide deacetylase family protein, partial [Pseudogracilibacillus sp.]|nr:polysaccharide deacetylase family protein [Pseudogracilibacillus sp.]